ncbi:MAG: hypothetical protein KBD83_05430 [Gammaproteobacteria bacterium]|nr:hypothetical protein [Gammaproteobacteria bacterium]
MSWKKVVFKALDIAEVLFSKDASSKKEADAPAYKFLYDESYYSGNMSYGERQNWKNYWSSKENSEA